MDSSTSDTANPYSLAHDCYADSRQLLGDKPALRRVAEHIRNLKGKHRGEEDEACAAFVKALDTTDISHEEPLDDVQPLTALPEIAAIACRECGKTVSSAEAGIARHIKTEHSAAMLTPDEGRELASRVKEAIVKHGGLTSSGAVWIPHGIHFFPSLALYLGGMACATADCGWVHLAGTKGKDHLKIGKQHVQECHGKVVASHESIHENLIYPLPVQRVERLDSNGGLTYFITCLPREWIVSTEEASDPDEKVDPKKRKREGHRTPEEKERRRLKKEKRRAARKAAASEGGA